eukprot:TRINITY_DN18211_c0_g2_i1.p1 TRINITY_DN18211_c0_g2~~TRINITY_DN18211_c0_g2_i1.p1  ORF type:complete len:247 (+),score=75.98 TRINITY_DN18211_c0_g2_i1:44-742(+)
MVTSCDVDAAQAKATAPQDEKEIKSLIEKESNFTEVNALVHRALWSSMWDAAKQAVQQSRKRAGLPPLSSPRGSTRVDLSSSPGSELQKKEEDPVNTSLEMDSQEQDPASRTFDMDEEAELANQSLDTDGKEEEEPIHLSFDFDIDAEDMPATSDLDLGVCEEEPTHLSFDMDAIVDEQAPASSSSDRPHPPNLSFDVKANQLELDTSLDVVQLQPLDEISDTREDPDAYQL